MKKRSFHLVAAFAVTAIFLILCFNCPAAEAVPEIEFVDSNSKFITFSYDRETRWLDVYHRFRVLWNEDIELYFKIEGRIN